MYKLINHRNWVGVKRLSDGCTIPLEPANKDYQEYLKWLEEGNTPLPADEPNEGTE
jgi:hypothetical protein